MTITSGPQIKVSDVSVEIGQSSSYSTSLSFLNGKIKPSQRPSTKKLSDFYDKAYFQNTTEGNCNNGNCTSNCNCGNIQCTNCVITNTINCTNCDDQQWLQTNCNCACTYNCDYGPVSYNCNCDCSCCVVATALTESGDWTWRQYLRINVWATRHLDKSWLGLRLHRGYHIIAPKYWMPFLQESTKSALSKYINWTFTNGTNMLMNKPYSKWSIPNTMFWVGIMTFVGFFTSKDTAERSWKSIAKK